MSVKKLYTVSKKTAQNIPSSIPVFWRSGATKFQASQVRKKLIPYNSNAWVIRAQKYSSKTPKTRYEIKSRQ